MGRTDLDLYLEEDGNIENFKEKLDKLTTPKNTNQNTHNVDDHEYQYVGAPETKEGVQRKIAKRTDKTIDGKLALRIPKSWHQDNSYDQREDWLQISTLEDKKEQFAEPNVIQ